MDYVNLAFALTALLISAITAYFSFFHRGRLLLTRPGFAALLFEEDKPKFFLRSLLYSTGQKGHAIEGLFLNATMGPSKFAFHFWCYGQREALVPGSGLLVDSTGVEVNHHFVQTPDAKVFELSQGATIYLEVMCRSAKDEKAKLLQELELEISSEQLSQLYNDKRNTALYFTWDPEKVRYLTSINRRPHVGRSRSVSGSGSGPFGFEM